MLKLLTQPEGTDVPPGMYLSARARYSPGFDPSPGYTSILYAMLISEDDWSQHQNQYTAMLAYAGSYQHYLSPDTLNTLFLSSGWQVLLVPFSADWREYIGDEEDVYLSPDDAPEVALRLTSLYRFQSAAPCTGDMFVCEQRAALR